jgi:hypothetical protein
VFFSPHLFRLCLLLCVCVPARWPSQVVNVDGAGAEGGATNGRQPIYIRGQFFGINTLTESRLVVTYGPSIARVTKYRAGPSYLSVYRHLFAERLPCLLNDFLLMIH